MASADFGFLDKFLRGTHLATGVFILRGTDTVTKLPWLSHETRRRSDGHVDGVTVASRRIDAIDANLKFGKREKRR